MPDPMDKLWQEYKLPFSEFDDLTLARWLAQTLSQLEGRLWRASHPLVSAFRLGADEGHQRQIWLKRLVNAPGSFPLGECCRAPLFPLFTRDVLNSGLLCQHCGATTIEFTDVPKAFRDKIQKWADDYSQVHAVAHWDEQEQAAAPNYDDAFEQAASQAEEFLRVAATDLFPPLLEYYPALVWEDQDECLEVQPNDIVLAK
jgi:hypothetical protein